MVAKQVESTAENRGAIILQKMEGREGGKEGGRKGGCVSLGKSEETGDKNPESKQMDLNTARP